MTSADSAAYRRPYLVVPKLIRQPTWGGTYIVEAKSWQGRGQLGKVKIGQSYELFSGSNLSLLDDSANPAFMGELTDRDAAQIPTRLPGTVPLIKLIADDADAVLGQPITAKRGAKLDLLLKFTQALGNSFQVHIKAGLSHPQWKPKPESWYYFEPGLITVGVKADTNWDEYQRCLKTVAAGMSGLSRQVRSGDISYDTAQDRIAALLKQENPWQFVNVVPTDADDVVDLTCGALHHSWEEDPVRAPQGNVLYELQSEAMDDISTFRGFDKGKMTDDGTIRNVHVDDYFDFIDRSPDINDPASHFSKARALDKSSTHELDRLMESPYYSLDRLTLSSLGAAYREIPGRFKHLFVKSGQIRVTAGEVEIKVGAGHSALVPAAAGEYQVTNETDQSQILISF